VSAELRGWAPARRLCGESNTGVILASEPVAIREGIPRPPLGKAIEPVFPLSGPRPWDICVRLLVEQFKNETCIEYSSDD